MKKGAILKVLSLFSGIGAFEKALKNIGKDFELVNYSKKINIDIANDYEKIYIEIINEEE